MNDSDLPVPQIQPAQERDLPAIAALAAAIWRACYPGIISSAQIEYMLARMYDLRTLREEMLTRGIRYDLLIAADTLIGFSSYGPTETAGVFKLHKLYLLPNWHGRGFGSQLLHHCEHELRKHDARCLILNVNKNNVKAIKSYRKNGFEIVKSVQNDIGEGFIMDDFMMAKGLDGTMSSHFKTAPPGNKTK